MADDEPKRFTKTAIAFQGGGALGAYSLGVLRYLYESEPGFRPSYVSGVSIGAFTAAILASAPEQPLHRLEQFWAELSIADLPFVPRWLEGNLSAFGNPAFYRPRMDYFDFANWTSYYDLSPIRATLERYVDLGRIARGEVKLAVTATDIASGEVVSFSNTDASKPLTLEHVIASGSLPPGFPPTVIENRAYWDGGLFSNTPLSALFDLASGDDPRSPDRFARFDTLFGPRRFELGPSGIFGPLARTNLRDDAYRIHRRLAGQILRQSGDTPEARIEAWIAANERPVRFALNRLSELQASGHADFQALAVAVRELRKLRTL